MTVIVSPYIIFFTVGGHIKKMYTYNYLTSHNESVKGLS